jgi:hypothetical protein
VILVEHIANVGILSIGVPIVEKGLTQFDYNNKITYKNYQNWDNLINSFIPSSINKIQQMANIISKSQINSKFLCNLCDNANILMFLQN